MVIEQGKCGLSKCVTRYLVGYGSACIAMLTALSCLKHTFWYFLYTGEFAQDNQSTRGPRTDHVSAECSSLTDSAP
ncbi:hypothetical protein scyTo_0013053 [Scyliorhinus torazame]|uniref:Uncharacterized protein n=1 Tax=Scyliorhinus torazame TaxID=75743 RepID=A0A401NND0_SCYTO|nr:hypothetical protein [Scyliorhinus torazame]